jgi:hypothetical protein
LPAFRVERSTSFDEAKLFDNAFNQSSLGERDSSSISVSGDGNAEDIFDGAVFERKHEHTELEHIQYEIVLFLWGMQPYMATMGVHSSMKALDIGVVP